MKKHDKKHVSKNISPAAQVNETKGITKAISQRTILVVGVIVTLLITFLTFSSAIKNDFVNWDDDWYILENQQVRSLSFDNIKEVSTHFFKGQYSPVTTLWLAVNYHFAELKPSFYHFMGVLLHVLNTGLVFLLVYQIVSYHHKQSKGKHFPVFVPIVAALLFGVNTMQVESVAWVSAQKVTVFSVFFLVSLIAYIQYLSSKKKRFFVLSILAFIISFCAKEQAMVLPLMLVAIDFYFERKLLDKQVIIEKVPAFVLALIFGVVSLLSQKNYGAISDSAWYSFIDRIPFAGYGFVAYLWKLIFPYNLCAFYPFPVPVGMHAPALYWIFPLISLAIIGLVLFSLRKTKLIFFAFSIYIINIFLSLQLISTGREVIIADRYAYIPSVGLFLLMGIGFQYLIDYRKNLAQLLTLVLAVYVGYLAFYSYDRCKVWKEGITFWTDVQQKFPTVHVAFYNCGNAKAALGKHQEAIEDFTKAIPLKPSHVGTYSNRGISLANLGKIKEALADFDKVVELDSNYSNVYSNRGNAKTLLGNFKGALADYNKAIRLDNSYADAYFNRGIVRDSLKDYKGAIEDWTEVIRRSPKFNNAYINRAVVRFKIGDFAGAKSDVEQVKKSEPDIVKKYYAFGLNNEKSGKLNDALDYYSKTIVLSPEYADAYFSRGAIYDSQNNLAVALKDYNKAIELNASNSTYYISRGVVKGKLGNLNEAMNDFNKAVELNPKSGSAYCNRGLAKMRLRQTQQAINDYSKAIELDSKFDLAYYNRALAYQNLKNNQAALSDFTKLIELQPNYADAYYNRGLIFYATNQAKKGCEDLQKAASMGHAAAKVEFERRCH